MGQSVRITTTLNDRPVTRHVVVLTVSRVGEISIPEKHEPWMAKTDGLPFPVEWWPASTRATRARSPRR